MVYGLFGFGLGLLLGLFKRLFESLRDEYRPHPGNRTESNMGIIASNEASSIAKKRDKYQWKRVFWRVRIGPAMSPVLSPCGAQLLPNGSDLGLSCTMLEPSWAKEVGPSWAAVGSWPKLTPSGADVADMWGRNGAFGRCSNLQNVQNTTVPCTFWRPARAI